MHARLEFLLFVHSMSHTHTHGINTPATACHHHTAQEGKGKGVGVHNLHTTDPGPNPQSMLEASDLTELMEMVWDCVGKHSTGGDRGMKNITLAQCVV